MERYKYLGSRKRHSSKSGKDYYLGFIELENDNGFDILQVMINQKQVNALDSVKDNNDFDISEHLKLEYNSYQKNYELKITYGL